MPLTRERAALGPEVFLDNFASNMPLKRCFAHITPSLGPEVYLQCPAQYYLTRVPSYMPFYSRNCRSWTGSSPCKSRPTAPSRLPLPYCNLRPSTSTHSLNALPLYISLIFRYLNQGSNPGKPASNLNLRPGTFPSISSPTMYNYKSQ